MRLGTVGVADRVIRAVGMLQRRPLWPVSGLADAVGLSERQLRRRVHAAAGYGPKTLQRVLRFQRFVRLIDASAWSLDLATAAASTGYADQSHLTRHFRHVLGTSPGRYARSGAAG